MTEFVLRYRILPDYVGSPDALAVWDEWFDSLGGNLIDRGNPVFVRKTLGNSDAETALGGYSLIKADDSMTYSDHLSPTRSSTSRTRQSPGRARPSAVSGACMVPSR
jgi:hypothetical protein